MIDDWSRAAEQLMLSTVESKIRVVAITGPVGGAGISTVASSLAKAFARSRRKTLLIDLSVPTKDEGFAAAWSPGDPLPNDAVKVGHDGLHLLTVAPTSANRALFSNVDILAKWFAQELAAFDNIVLDLPAIEDALHDTVNPVAAARASDAVFLVCLTGLTLRGEMSSAVQKLRQVGANVTGVILNDQYCVRLGEEIADVADTRLGRHFPRTAEWIGHKAKNAAFLRRTVS